LNYYNVIFAKAHCANVAGFSDVELGSSKSFRIAKIVQPGTIHGENS
jgi:hypothetical protein